MKYLKNYLNIVCILSLIFISILVFCLNLSGYPFIDTDETKLVLIAKNMLNNSDWINIRYLNHNFFDLSPLYFWLVNLSCVIFAKISTETIRLPISLVTIAGIYTVYFAVKQILTKRYAAIISLIYACSFAVIVFSHLATQDIIFSTFAIISVLFGYSAIFSKKYNALFLLLTYIFSAFSFLTAGLFGFIPLIAVFLMFILSGKIKDFIKPINFIPGIVLFLLLTLPWYLIMFHKHNFTFFQEFLNSYNINSHLGIKQSFTMLILFVLGFLPWIFSFLFVLFSNFNKICKSIFSYIVGSIHTKQETSRHTEALAEVSHQNSQFLRFFADAQNDDLCEHSLDNSQNKLNEKWNKLRKIEKFIFLNYILFFIDLIFALIYGEDYIFLILFLIFPASCISGHYWYEYIVKSKHDKSIFFATIIPNLVLIICSLAGLFGHNILNEWLNKGLSHLFIPLVLIFFVIPVISICSVLLKWRVAAFIMNVILVVSLSFVITPGIFNFMAGYGGENDLIAFAQEAGKNKIPLAAYISSRKYSLEYYYDKPVQFIKADDINKLGNFMEENPDTYIVVEIKDMINIEENIKNYTIIDTGKRYCLIKYLM